ncbi:MAG: PspC domain-containing protein [Actinobacteria bacterium]|nr:PspC domain-containing protein [Actinomycetota bacterium]
MRSPDDRVLAGIAGGVGERLGIDPMLVRIAFVVLAAAGAVGLGLYLLLWAFSREVDELPPSQPRRIIAPSLQQALALLTLVVGALLLCREIGLWFGDALVWPLALAALGSAVVWARGGEEERDRWTRYARRVPQAPVRTVLGERISVPRLVVGAALVVVGAITFLTTNYGLRDIGNAFIAVAVAATGAVLLLGPYIARLVNQVGAERRERIRSEERAEVAAHLHDSVLQTLALLQRADDPQRVRQLARRQERELRQWLYGRSPDGAEGTTLQLALDALADEIEADHNVTVEAVVVGDAPLGETERVALLACREAVLNAAVHSGAPLVQVYIERDGDELEVFVRDRGRGFDPAAVPTDRRGLADSVRGRVERAGGAVTITSAPAEGTEVELRLPVRGAEVHR